MRCGLLPRRLTTAVAGGRELFRPAVQTEEGRHGGAARCTPKQPSTLKRLLHLGSFAASSFFPLMAQRRWKPDRIIGVVPTLFYAECACWRNCLVARTVLHIQDYEVDAMLGLGLAGKGKGGKVAQLATAFERSGLHNVDNVSTISRSMMNKAIEKGVAAENVISSPTGQKLPVFSMSQTPMLMPFVTSLPAG